MKKLLFVSCAAVSMAAFAAPFKNPVVPGFYSDPSVCVGPDGKFCLATSTLQFFPIIPLFESEDLVHWTLKGHAVEKSGVTPLGGELEFAGYFAPTLRYHNGRFYLVASNHAKDPNGKVLGPMIMTAPRLEGPWSEPRKLPVGSFGDPSLDFIGDKCYFTGTTGRMIRLAEYDPERNVLLEEPRDVWSGTGGTYPEGPHVFKRGDWYYLMMAEGGTEYGHAQTIARSRSVYGPYEGCPHNPIAGHARLKAQGSRLQGVGHGDFVYDKDGNGFFICHAFRPQYGKNHLVGREVIAAPMEWTADGWPLVNGGRPIPDQPFNLENLPAVDWIWIRNPKTDNYVFDSEKGAVALQPSAVKLSDKESPTFVGTRQTAIDQDFSVVLESKAAEGVEVGIVSYMGRTHHMALVVARRGGRDVAFVRYQLGLMRFESAPVTVEAFPLRLRIEARAKIIRFLADGKLVGEGDPRHIGSEVNSDSPYNGIIFGMFAEGPAAAGRVKFAYDLKTMLKVAQ